MEDLQGPFVFGKAGGNRKWVIFGGLASILNVSSCQFSRGLTSCSVAKILENLGNDDGDPEDHWCLDLYFT